MLVIAVPLAVALVTPPSTLTLNTSLASSVRSVVVTATSALSSRETNIFVITVSAGAGLASATVAPVLRQFVPPVWATTSPAALVKVNENPFRSVAAFKVVTIAAIAVPALPFAKAPVATVRLFVPLVRTRLRSSLATRLLAAGSVITT